MFTLPKSERLHGKSSISALLNKGRWGAAPSLKYCFLIAPQSADSQPNAMMVSVPKRLFKRAVKRNLLKRRIREAYRLQKHLVPPQGVSMLFQYNSKEIMEFAEIYSQVGLILKRISEAANKKGVK